MRYLVARLSLMLILLLIASTSQALEWSCETQFSMSGSAEKGLIFNASRLVRNIDTRNAIRQLRTVAEREGSHIVSEDYAAGKGNFVYVRRAETGEYVADVTAEDTGRIRMMAAMLPGSNADPVVMRSSMCNILGSIRVDADAVATGEHSVGGDRSRTAPPETRPKNKVLRPQAIFNLEQAHVALQPGTAKITGTACVQRQGNLILAGNYPIYLYPVTPYMEEAIGLLRKDYAGKAGVELSQIAMATRMQGQANEKGEFQFSKMKPGRYYLMTTLSSTFMNQRQVKAGSYSGGFGGLSGDIYRVENYQTEYEDLLEEIVEIKQDGETVKVALTPRLSLKTGGLAGLFGCRRL